MRDPQPQHLRDRPAEEDAMLSDYRQALRTEHGRYRLRRGAPRGVGEDPILAGACWLTRAEGTEVTRLRQAS